MSDQDLLKDAREFFDEAADKESELRDEWREAMAFRALEQWDPQALKSRDGRNGEPPRPSMVIDQIDQYVRQIVNDARMNPPAMRAIPMNDKGAIEAAEQLQGMFRYIEAVSRGQDTYISALDAAVTMGRGAFRVRSELVDGERNLWEPRISRIHNPMMVYFDPYSVEMDGSDANDAMVIRLLSKRQFKREYPKASTTASWDSRDGCEGWITDEGIRVAEWHSVVHGDETVVETGDGEMTEDEARERKPENFRERKRTTKRCIVRIVTGAEVIEENEAHCNSVGIIPVYGTERYTDERRHLRGAVRPAMDAQRLLNFLASNMAEAASAAPRAPWLVPEGAIEGYEAFWDRANFLSLPYLPYKSLDAHGQPISPPTRNAIDMNLMGYISAIESVKGSIQSTMGMYQASVGAPGQEKSGVAIRERKNESDVGTFHYNANLAVSVQHAGRLMMQMIPKLYDVARVVQILGEDNQQRQIRVDPQAPDAYSKGSDAAGKQIVILNPTIGEYDIQVSTGPSFTSRRQEAAADLREILSRSPDLMSLIGDLYFGMLDSPAAAEMSKRLKLMLPPVVKAAEEAGDDIPAEVVAIVEELRQMLDQREQGLTATLDQLGKIGEQVQSAYNRLVQKGADIKVAEADLAIEKFQVEQAQQQIAQQQGQIELMLGAAQPIVDAAQFAGPPAEPAMPQAEPMPAEMAPQPMADPMQGQQQDPMAAQMPPQEAQMPDQAPQPMPAMPEPAGPPPDALATILERLMVGQEQMAAGQQQIGQLLNAMAIQMGAAQPAGQEQQVIDDGQVA